MSGPFASLQIGEWDSVRASACQAVCKLRSLYHRCLIFAFMCPMRIFAWKCVFMRGNPDFIRPSFARIGNMPNGDRPSGARGEEGRLNVRATDGPPSDAGNPDQALAAGGAL